MDFTDRPAQRILIASVARRYYLEGRSKVEIGEELGLSRFKVARLLETARDSGLVHIEIADPDMIDVDLSAQLQDAYDLRHAVVVETPDDNPTTLRERIGNAAAELLSEIVTADDVLGLAWSRSVSAMTNALNRLPTIPVVQLSGALVQPDMADSSVDLVRQAARISGGAAHFFYAPTVVSDQATARALRKQPEIARTFGQFGSVTKAVVGVGLWSPGESTVYDVTDEKIRRELHHHGICAEIAGVLIDADGHPAKSDLTERMIGVSAAQLRAIPEVIGLAYSTARSPAVQAAIRGGYVKSLVTHPSLARTLLAQQENRPQPDPPKKGDLAPTQVGSSSLTASRSSD
jgi:DNA-binding transcriptional regulator LsrR (DeoR family)